MIAKNIFIRFVQQVLQFCISIAIARYIGPAGNGIFSLFIADVSFLILILGLSAESSILYFTSKNKLNLSDILSLLFPIVLVQIIVCVILYFATSFIFGYHLFKTSLGNSDIFYGLLFIISCIIFNYFYAFLVAKKGYFKVVFINVICQLVFLIGLISMHEGWVGDFDNFFIPSKIIPAYCLLFFVQAVVTLLYTLYKNGDKINFRSPQKIITSEILKYTLQVNLSNVLQFLAYRIDIWILDYYHSKDVVGQYSLSVKISQVFWLLPQLTSSMLFPLTAQNDARASEQNFKKISKIIFILTIVGAGLSILLYPVFTKYVVGDIYQQSFIYFLYLLPGVCFFGICILLSARFAGKGNVQINLMTSAICFVLLLIFGVVLIPIYAAKGAAIATSIGYIASTLFIIFMYKRWIKN